MYLKIICNKSQPLQTKWTERVFIHCVMHIPDKISCVQTEKRFTQQLTITWFRIKPFSCGNVNVRYIALWYIKGTFVVTVLEQQHYSLN